jgi:hypothetical protein
LGPTPRCRRQLVTRLKPRTGMVSQKAGSPGRSRISRKAIAQGRPDASAKPVCLRAPSCCNYRTQDRGCGAHPVFPAPSDFEGKVSLKNFGRIASRECEVVSINPSSPPSAQLRTGRGDPYAAAEIIQQGGRRASFSNLHLWLRVGSRPGRRVDGAVPTLTPPPSRSCRTSVSAPGSRTRCRR